VADVGGWLDEVPLDPGPPHVRLGVRRIPESAWLLPDEQRPAELALKDRLLADRRAEVVAVATADRSTVVAQAETLALVTDWLRRYEPALVRPRRTTDGPTGATARDEDARTAAATAHSRHRAPDLEAAARLVQEDLCLMAVGDGPPVLTAAVLCFPSHWRVAEKIGRPMAAIHEPVPDYADSLGNRPDRVLDRLAGDRIVARRNWSVHDGGELFAPVAPAERPLAVDDVPDRLWLRSERQTLRRLPADDHVLFTIRVQQTPFGALRGRPDIAARLRAAVQAEAPVRRDRFAGGHVAPMLEWLDRQGT
jgi:hypothetical protein